MVAAGSRQLENVIDNITEQVVHTTHVTAQDYKIQNLVPTWPFLRPWLLCS